MLDLNQYAHSHDSIEIVQQHRQSCVRKTFGADLARAQRNVEKQRQFRPMFTGAARVAAAEVLDFQLYADRAELLMPYVEGITGHMLPVLASRQVAHTLSQSLSTLLYTELNDSHEDRVPTALFQAKLHSVLAATPDSELRTLVHAASVWLDRLPAELDVPLGPCHGDLTLSNLIFDPLSGVTLIDFLDTFLESPLQDVAKLKQDFVYGWSFRRDPVSLGVKAEILCRYHLPQAIPQIERMYPTQVRVMTLMSLARIAPYVRDALTKQWLILSLKHCLEEACH